MDKDVKHIRQIQGKVVSVKMNKTIIVSVIHMTRHPKYLKMMKQTRKFAVHNENITVNVGDNVIFTESKPISKTKHYVLNRIIKL